jgi:hypothetical protein
MNQICLEEDFVFIIYISSNTDCKKEKFKCVFISSPYGAISIFDKNMVLNQASYILNSYLDKFQ